MDGFKNLIGFILDRREFIAGWMVAFFPVALMVGNVGSDIFLITISIIFLLDSFLKKDFSWMKRPWIMMGLALWGYASIRGLFSDAPLESFYHAAVWCRFLFFAAALAVWILPQEKWQRRLLDVLLGVTGFLAFDTIFQYMTGFDLFGRVPTEAGRLTSVFSRPIVGMTIATLFFPVLAKLLHDKKLFFGFLYIALCSMAVLLSGERTAFAFALSGSMLFFLFAARQNKMLPFLFLILFASIAYLVFYTPDLYARQIYETKVTLRDFFASHYGALWQSAISIFKEHPLFGVGVHRFRDYCPDPLYGAPFFPNGLGRCGLHVHNNYLEWLAEGGAFGFSLFVGVALALLVRWGRAFKAHRQNPVFLFLGVLILFRLLPFIPVSSFFHTWAVAPLWLMIGWGMAFDPSAQKTPQKILI